MQRISALRFCLQRIRHIVNEKNYVEKKGKNMEIKYTKRGEKDYPKRLAGMENAPDKLYYLGDISLLNKNVVALIGKRDVSEKVMATAKRCGEILTERGAVVLNGLAIGCDTAGLEDALAAGGKCIAVMPCGLDYVYPKCNDALVRKILQHGGCIVSEYETGTRPERWRFVARDRIQAMLSDKIVVVECEEKSGTMHTVKAGMEYKKPLACIIRVKESVLPSGNQWMLKNGAAGLKGENALRRFVEGGTEK